MAILPPDPAYLLRGDMGPVHSLLFRVSPYVEHIYAGTESGIIHIWDLKVFLFVFSKKENFFKKLSFFLKQI